VLSGTQWCNRSIDANAASRPVQRSRSSDASRRHNVEVDVSIVRKQRPQHQMTYAVLWITEST